MTTPRGTYGGGYYASSAFPDTPIYDSLVAERGTPQIAPIRVPMPYENASHLPALPAALPALPPAGSSQPPMSLGQTGTMPAAGYQTAGPQQPTAYIPQQVYPPRPYPGGYPTQAQPVYPAGTGYEAARPVPPRPFPPRPAAPGGYPDEQARRPYPPNGSGY